MKTHALVVMLSTAAATLAAPAHATGPPSQGIPGLAGEHVDAAAPLLAQATGSGAENGGTAAPSLKPGRDADSKLPGQAEEAAPSRPAPPASIVGADVLDPKGEKIAEAVGIDGSRVIVSFGGFLGIGAKKAAVAWNRFTVGQSNGRSVLVTGLTEEQLRDLPAYQEPKVEDAEPRRGAAPAGDADGGARR